LVTRPLPSVGAPVTKEAILHLSDHASATQRAVVVTGHTDSLPSIREPDARAPINWQTLDEFGAPGSQGGGRRASQELASASGWHPALGRAEFQLDADEVNGTGLEA
jgi:hypothetical protein